MPTRQPQRFVDLGDNIGRELPVAGTDAFEGNRLDVLGRGLRVAIQTCGDRRRGGALRTTGID